VARVNIQMACIGISLSEIKKTTSRQNETPLQADTYTASKKHLSLITLRPANDTPQYIWPVIVNRFSTPALKVTSFPAFSHCKALCQSLVASYSQIRVI